MQMQVHMPMQIQQPENPLHTITGYIQPPTTARPKPLDTGEPSRKKVFVGGLPHNIDGQALGEAFSGFGVVEDAMVSVHLESGRSRCFGFVIFESDHAAEAAIDLSNEFMIEGKWVEIKTCVPENMCESGSRFEGQDPGQQLVQTRSGPYHQSAASSAPHEAAAPYGKAPRGADPQRQPRTERSNDQGSLVKYHPCKIFVGRLDASVDLATLTSHFSQFGTIAEAKLPVDKNTGQHRGFGYVTYTTTDAVENALSNPELHVVQGKGVDVKRCAAEDSDANVPTEASRASRPARSARLAKPAKPARPVAHSADGSSAPPGVPTEVKKIFVGGLPRSVPERLIREHFQKFGEIVEIEVVRHKDSGEPRGFCYVTFTDTEAVEAVMANYEGNSIDGKWVECKECIPKENIVPGSREIVAPPPLPPPVTPGFQRKRPKTS